MKITSISNIYSAYNVKPTVSNKKSVGGLKKDDVNVSNKAREFQAALRAVSASSEIREDKVNEIKTKIDEGSYNISAEAIADKILSNL